jgi:hypothetical protein
MAVHSDVDEMIALAEASHLESRFGYIPFSETKARKIIDTALSNEKRNGLMLALKDEKLVGAAYCSIGELHIGESVLLTTIHNINVLKNIRSTLSGGQAALGLLKGIETWSKARGAQEILFHITSSVNLARSHKLVKRVGYKFVGGSYVKSQM